MTNMRRGFTMIELIFVIVIIGILAAVAIPKLAATRDDAKIANIIANARTLTGDFTAYYTSQGETNFKTAVITDITAVPVYTGNACAAATLATSATDAQVPLYICSEQDGDLIVTFDANDTHLSVTSATDVATKTVLHGVVTDPAFVGITGGSGQTKDYTLGGVGVQR